MRKSYKYTVVLTLFIAFMLGACCGGPQVKKPAELKAKAPAPIEDNSGKYMCPYTSDGTVAEWTAKGKSARFGAAIGGAIGREIGQKVLENIPFVGGWLGKKAGNAAGRAAAIKMSGGMEYIKETSDLSFNSLDNMSLFLYVNFSHQKDYMKVLQLTQEIYPDMKEQYYRALQKASK